MMATVGFANRFRSSRWLVCLALSGLAACEGVPGAQQQPAATAVPEQTRMVETEVEDPAAFRIRDKGLWDGRPTFGGVWVAYPEIATPERVVVRNAETGREVNGAVYRRDPGFVGPAIELSSDAAAALGMLAGVPANLEIIALRKKEVVVLKEPEPETGQQVPERRAAPEPAPQPEPAQSAPEPAPAAPPAAEPAKAPTQEAAATPAPAPAAPPPQPADRDPRFIQVAISSNTVHADALTARLNRAGIQWRIRERIDGDKKSYVVLAGPITTSEQLRAWMAKIREMGYTDAFVQGN